MWTTQLNAVLGSVVVTVGVWLVWGAVPLAGLVTLALALAGFLVWRGNTVAQVWAWSTLFLGLSSFAWPLVTMIRVRLDAPQPTDEQMGTILNAVLFGLFSGVFWISFAYGLFKRTARQNNEQEATIAGNLPKRRIDHKTS
ncbi:MAG: hypothetical protein ACT4OO_09540 [Nitrospiraceae bacterium]